MAKNSTQSAKGALFWALPDSGEVRVGRTEAGSIEVLWLSLAILPESVLSQLNATGTQYWYPSPPNVPVPDATWAVNFCTDADVYSKGLAWLDETWTSSVPVFNAPEAVRQTARERKTELFGHIAGLTVPETVRTRFETEADLLAAFEKSGLSYPVILRPTKMQGGIGMIRVDGPDGWSAAIGTEFMREEHFMIQYVDYKTSDGEFLKARVLFIGGVPYLRHVKAASEWMVHNNSAFQIPDFAKTREIGMLDILEADEDFMRICRNIGASCDMDYFGADIGIDLSNRRFVLFEANATMAAFFRLRDDLNEVQLLKRARFQDRPAEALAALIADPSKWRSQPASAS